jgi:hypothetical protein
LLPASWWFLAWHFLWPWTWRQHIPLKRQLIFNGLRSVISQKTEFFITTAVEPQTLQNLCFL